MLDIFSLRLYFWSIIPMNNVWTLYFLALEIILVLICQWSPLPMEFSWQEYWSGLPFPTPVLTK